ncbi:N-acyl-D-amino-acid deacylase family protein [Sinosporangium siamense]|uniref:N-acyl-D-amino-acid deacylase n=1 Tax=Sinosporangium siamense TaxID=1367973 RepID=A0A919RMJ2_9ACTN|nr:D-aminoacylase [Sinosporangium siamense]GII95937.1 N-acyl-D-amino-acid deacylase [Sinosporangium siamense]
MIIKDATIADGTGGPLYTADVRVANGTVTEIGSGLGGGPTLDAAGLVLAPGFIDMHAHSDLLLLTEPDHLAKVSQGVTLEVLGQDGLSYAPVDDTTLEQLRRHIAGWNGDPAGFDWDWRSVGEYLDRLDRGIAVNACYLIPHSNVRMLAMGWDDRPATPAELDRQKQLIATAMAEGAVGMSAGLTYTPGMYAPTGELTELCRVVGEHGGYFSPHHRSYGAGALEAYAEMVALSRESGCPLHLAHATMNFGVNEGRAGELLDLLDKAIEGGCDISLDTYPYLPGSTTLSALLPSWASAGGPEHTLARLADPAERERIRLDLEVHGSDGCHGVVTDWRTIQISGVANPDLAYAVGATVADLAAAQGRTGTEVFFDLLLADRLATGILMHVGHEENVRAIMRHPAHTGGSDGLLVGARPHPRAWGTFPRFLGHYVRELGVLSLAECVAHLTGRAARRLKLDRRGLVKEGYHADLVLFDPDTVRDTATYEEPRQQAEGIPYVFVAGVAVVAEGRHTGALPGGALRGTPAGTARRGTP